MKECQGFTTEKNWRSHNFNFSQIENLKKCTSFEELKGTWCIRWNFFQLSFVHKTLPQISFNMFSSEDKTLLSEFLKKWVWIQGHNEQFPKYLD